MARLIKKYIAYLALSIAEICLETENKNRNEIKREGKRNGKGK